MPDASDAENQYLNVLMALRAAIVVVDSGGNVRFANPAAVGLFAIERPDILGEPFGLPLTGDGRTADIELRTAAGPVAVEMQTESCTWAGDEATVVLLTDVTHRVHSEDRLKALKERLELATAGGGDMLFDWDLRTGHFHLSHAEALLGPAVDQPIAEVDPALWLDRVHADDRDGLEHALADHLYGTEPQLDHDHRLRHSSGVYRWMRVRARAGFEDGDAVRLSGVLTNIDEQRSREDQLLHDSLHDALTGLANRVLFIDRLDHAIQRSVWEPRRRYGVLLIDLDGFKAVNDNYGHAAGDALLVDLAERMVAAVRPGDTVARLGGDEFGVLADSFTDQPAFDALAARLRTALSQPVTLGDREVAVSASIGGVVSGRRPDDPTALLEQADAAMYQAKASGGDRTMIIACEDGQSSNMVSMRVTSWVVTCVGFP